MSPKNQKRNCYIYTYVSEETFLALTAAAVAAGVTRTDLIAETLTVAMGGDRTCAMS